MPTPGYPDPDWFDLPEDQRVIRLTPAETKQLLAALDEEPRVIPELAAAIRKVREQFPEAFSTTSGPASSDG